MFVFTFKPTSRYQFFTIEGVERGKELPINIKDVTSLGIGVKACASNPEELKRDFKPDLHLKPTVEGNGIITGIKLYSG